MSDRDARGDTLRGVPTEEEFPVIRRSDVEAETARAAAAGPGPAGGAAGDGRGSGGADRDAAAGERGTDARPPADG